jgi:fructose-1,6-bisphosphatase/inositol monophosphatase family enzyme
MEPAIEDMVEFYLPVLVTAGDYARQIQPRISGPAAKAGQNPWVQAITDADHSVQAFLEVATLARFPTAGFYGEEQAESRNARYFAPDAGTTVWLDPINGTFLYKNQRPGWDIILSISRGGRLMAAISYMPVRERFHLAVRSHGAFSGGREARRLADLAPLATSAASTLCLTYQAPAALAALRPRWPALDIVADDDPGRALDNLSDIFTGRLGAYASEQGDLLDWGAMAFIVTEAGGAASGLDGRPFGGFESFHAGSADMLVAATPDLHAALLATLQGRTAR